MDARPSWKGFLRLSLVSVPVKAYSSAVSGRGEIHLHQLHDKCHSRIRYQKTCPIHGEVSNDEIVTGYEYAKGQYVIVEKEEMERDSKRGDKPVNIDTFIPASEISPACFDGRNFYLVPDGAAGQKPFALLYRAMEDEGRYAVVLAPFSGRDQPALLRPTEGLFLMSLLGFDSQIKKPVEFRDEAAAASVSADELRLAKLLLKEAAVDALDLSRYQDTYTQKLTAMIDAKIAGREVIAEPTEEPAPVINLMQALRESVARVQGTAKKKPPKKVAPSTSALRPVKRRRKSS